MVDKNTTELKSRIRTLENEVKELKVLIDYKFRAIESSLSRYLSIESVKKSVKEVKPIKNKKLKVKKNGNKK